ncbi:hypothetical protein EYF80_027809 [Liparis tanakae]|uniref:Uncharacterized protein n=1 Tax=Liparis tanakae TaxID=230148 RepID=A0A4Z2HAQ8_9TELE|nr:hypothetical protein EYF80_027809 [Liparis tanakae]
MCDAAVVNKWNSSGGLSRTTDSIDGRTTQRKPTSTTDSSSDGAAAFGPRQTPFPFDQSIGQGKKKEEGYPSFPSSQHRDLLSAVSSPAARAVTCDTTNFTNGSVRLADRSRPPLHLRQQPSGAPARPGKRRVFGYLRKESRRKHELSSDSPAPPPPPSLGTVDRACRRDIERCGRRPDDAPRRPKQADDEWNGPIWTEKETPPPY